MKRGIFEKFGILDHPYQSKKEIIVEVDKDYGKHTWRPEQDVVDIYQNHRDAQKMLYLTKLADAFGISLDAIRHISIENQNILFSMLLAIKDKAKTAQTKDNYSEICREDIEKFKNFCRQISISLELQNIEQNLVKLKKEEYQPPLIGTINNKDGELSASFFPSPSLIPITHIDDMQGFSFLDQGFGYDYGLIELFGATLKKEYTHQAGALGEGIDMTILSLLRNGAEIYLLSNYNNVSWQMRSKIENETLKLEILEGTNPSAMSGSATFVIFPDISGLNDNLEKIKNMILSESGYGYHIDDYILDYSNDDSEGYPKGKLLFNKKRKVYVMGLWIENREDILFSYDLNEKFSFKGRDRKHVHNEKLFEIIREMLISNPSPQVRRHIVSALHEGKITIETELLVSPFLDRDEKRHLKGGLLSKDQLDAKWLNTWSELFLKNASKDKELILTDDSIDLSLIKSLETFYGKDALIEVSHEEYELINYLNQKHGALHHLTDYKTALARGQDHNSEDDFTLYLKEKIDKIRNRIIQYASQKKRRKLLKKAQCRNNLLLAGSNIDIQFKPEKKTADGAPFKVFITHELDRVKGIEIEVYQKNFPEPWIETLIVPPLIACALDESHYSVTTQSALFEFYCSEIHDDIEEVLSPFTKIRTQINKAEPKEQNTEEIDNEKLENKPLKLLLHLEQILHELIQKVQSSSSENIDQSANNLCEEITLELLEFNNLYPLLYEKITSYLNNFLNFIIYHKASRQVVIFYLKNNSALRYKIYDAITYKLSNSPSNKPSKSHKMHVIPLNNLDQTAYYEGKIRNSDCPGSEDSNKFKIYQFPDRTIIEIEGEIVSENKPLIINKSEKSDKLYAYLDKFGSNLILFIVDKFGYYKPSIIELHMKRQMNYTNGELLTPQKNMILETAIEISFDERELQEPERAVREAIQNHIDSCSGIEIPSINIYTVNHLRGWKIDKMDITDLSKANLAEDEIIIGIEISDKGSSFPVQYLQKLGLTTKTDLDRGYIGEGLKMISLASLQHNFSVEFESADWSTQPFSKEKPVWDAFNNKQILMHRLCFDAHCKEKRPGSCTKIFLFPNIHEGNVFTDDYKKMLGTSGFEFWKKLTNVIDPRCKNGSKKGIERYICTYQKNPWCIRSGAVTALRNTWMEEQSVYEQDQLFTGDIIETDQFFFHCIYNFHLRITDNRERSRLDYRKVRSLLKDFIEHVQDENYIKYILEISSTSRINGISTPLSEVALPPSRLALWYKCLKQLYPQGKMLSMQSLIKSYDANARLLDAIFGSPSTKGNLGNICTARTQTAFINENHFPKEEKIVLNRETAQFFSSIVPNATEYMALQNETVPTIDIENVNELEKIINKIRSEIIDSLRQYYAKHPDFLMDSLKSAYHTDLFDEMLANFEVKNCIAELVKYPSFLFVMHELPTKGSLAHTDFMNNNLMRFFKEEKKCNTYKKLLLLQMIIEENRYLGKIWENLDIEEFLPHAKKINIPRPDCERLQENIMRAKRLVELDAPAIIINNCISTIVDELVLLIPIYNISLSSEVESFFDMYTQNFNPSLNKPETIYHFFADLAPLITELRGLRNTKIQIKHSSWHSYGEAKKTEGENLLTLNQKIFSSPEKLYHTVVHELIHLIDEKNKDYSENFQHASVIIFQAVIERLKKNL